MRNIQVWKRKAIKNGIGANILTEGGKYSNIIGKTRFPITDYIIHTSEAIYNIISIIPRIL